MKKIMIVIIFTLCVLIGLKKESFSKFFYKHIYNNNLSFMSINNIYENIFGSSIPFGDFIKTEPVFSESLVYSSYSEYLDGIVVSVDDNYLVPVLDSGLVLYVGPKEGYGNVVIVEQGNGIDVWYGNISESVKLYDYVVKGSLLGSISNNQLYLVYMKDGKVLNYEEYF